mgnify:CR=1 FL=1
MTTSPEIYFYHLEQATLEQVLPQLLEKTLERGWKAVVQAGSKERLDALDTTLWTYAEGSFLPHGTTRDGSTERQPVFLTTATDRPNGADVRFLVDRAHCEDVSGYARVVILFDGGDAEALAAARADWKRLTGQGLAATYWQQGPGGKWVKKA